MSPYRVVAKHSNCLSKDTVVLASMLTVDKHTGIKHIYILEKRCLGESGTSYTDTNIAYTRTELRASNVLDMYTIQRTEKLVSKGYDVIHIDPWYMLPDPEPTQQRCLVAAMNDFCKVNSLEITQVL